MGWFSFEMVQKQIYKKILVLEIVQEKKFTLLHFEWNGLMIRLAPSTSPPLPPPQWRDVISNPMVWNQRKNVEDGERESEGKQVKP